MKETSRMNRRESIFFHISVEGKNCETMYFEHLANLINHSALSVYNLKVSPKKMLPSEYAKRVAHMPANKVKGKNLPYIHIQDIEDFYDDKFKQKFYNLIDDIRKTEEDFNIKYELGYSNYSFELWMLLHVTDVSLVCDNRYSYLSSINRYFESNFRSLDDFKQKDNFKKILERYITLASVFQALHRADRLVSNNQSINKSSKCYRNFKFYCDNPDTTVHEVIKIIFSTCGVKET